MIKTTYREIGKFLEERARIGEPITYSQVIAQFPELPQLTAAWRSHPLCDMFGELDREDERQKLPFRTALVVGQKSGRPGQGFFDTITKLRNQPISKSQRDEVWSKEFTSLVNRYSKPLRDGALMR